jgi:hypothetical protein
MANYKCANGHAYSAPSLGETAYGEFLLWTARGEMAYLNAFEDTTYKEVDNIIKTHAKVAGMQPLDQARILCKVCGKLACDRGQRGGVFSIDSAPPCPVCGSQRVASWEFPSPPNVIDVHVQPVTHAMWSSLADEEKQRLRDSELEDI